MSTYAAGTARLNSVVLLLDGIKGNGSLDDSDRKKEYTKYLKEAYDEIGKVHTGTDAERSTFDTKKTRVNIHAANAIPGMRWDMTSKSFMPLD